MSALDDPRFRVIRNEPEMLRNLLASMVMAAILVGYAQSARRGRVSRSGILAFAWAALLVFGVRGAYRLAEMARDLREWDFLAFWVAARVAAAGHDFYDPEWLHRVPLPAPPSASFVAEELNVGFLYPPWTMLFLEPIGELDPLPAAILWAIFHWFALVASVILLWRVFLGELGWRGLLLAAVLTLGFQPTTDTLAFGQTNFLLLLTLTAFWAKRDRPIGGVYLGLATIVKPLAIIFVLFPLIRRSWRVLGMAAVTLLCAAGISGWVFGWSTWRHYLLSNPAGALPRDVHVQDNRQSLLAEVLRVRSPDGATSLSQALQDPYFLGIAGIIALVTCWAVARSVGTAGDLSLALVFPCALLLYPGELTYHAVILLVPLLYLWTARDRIGLGVAITILLITAIYALTRIHLSFDSFYAYLLLWLVTVYLVARERREPVVAWPRP